MHRTANALLCLLLAPLIAACDGNESFVSVGPGDGPRGPILDGGLDGGQLLPDGATRYLPDGATRLLPDGATRYLPDGALRDPSGGDGDSGDTPFLDAGLTDGGFTSQSLEGCTVDEDAVWRHTVPFGDEGGHALTPGGTGFGIAYRLDDGCDAIEGNALASAGPFPRPVVVLGENSCAVFRDLSLLRNGDQWLLAWIDNRTGSSELHYRHFEADMTEPGDITRVTDNGVSEQKPALTRIGQTPVLAWIEGDESQRGIRSTVIDGDQTHLVLDPEAGHLPLKLAIARMGSDDAAAVAWVNEEGDRGVWLQPLDSRGAPKGTPTELTDFASAGSTVDVATRTRGADSQQGGAAVYSVIVENINREVRFRRLAADGRPIEAERVLVGRPLRAQDASISEIGDGYVVAYRALPDGITVMAPEIRLLFVTREGTVQRDPIGRALTYKVANATATQGRTTVRASVEGQLLISWLDFDPATGHNTLKMTRRRLDCPSGD
ncbi:MAG: hypothetical protein OXU20_37740 [Myxococcales bacterium]|nr:hypothetical protein [Myxococcales bacterium]